MQYKFAPACVNSPEDVTHEPTPVTGYTIAVDADDGTRQLMHRRSRGAWTIAIWHDEEVAQHVATHLPAQAGTLTIVPISMPVGETADVLS